MNNPDLNVDCVDASSNTQILCNLNTKTNETQTTKSSSSYNSILNLNSVNNTYSNDEHKSPLVYHNSQYAKQGAYLHQSDEWNTRKTHRENSMTPGERLAMLHNLSKGGRIKNLPAVVDQFTNFTTQVKHMYLPPF